MKYLSSIIVFLSAIVSFAQTNLKPLSQLESSKLLSNKLTIDFNAIQNWPAPGNIQPSLSPNGKYVSYLLTNYPENHASLFVKKTEGEIIKSFIADQCDNSFYFSIDNTTFIFKNGDTLFLYDLDSDKVDSIVGIRSWKAPVNSKGKWVAAILNSEKSLLLIDLQSNKKTQFKYVTNYEFDKDGTILVLKYTINIDDSIKNMLKVVSLKDEKVFSIFSTGSLTKLLSFSIDNKNKGIAFVVQETVGKDKANSIWYYNSKTKLTSNKVRDKAMPLFKDLILSNSLIQFSGNGKWIFFELKLQTNNPPVEERYSKVDIWSYKDNFLNFSEGDLIKNWLAAIGTDSDKMMLVKGPDETLVLQPGSFTGDYIVTSKDPKTKFYWNKYINESYWLKFLESGESIEFIEESKSHVSNFNFSPEGKWIVYWNSQELVYKSYNIGTGRTISLTKQIPPVDRENTTGIYRFPEADIAAWFPADSALILYDRFDIWQVDPAGHKLPKNITNYCGSKTGTKFRLLYDQNISVDKTIVRRNEILLIVGFNSFTKENGFYEIKMGSSSDPKMLTSQSCVFYKTESQLPNYSASSYLGNGICPVKAENERAYVLIRQSPNSYPNYVFTKDFKKFINITDLQPQTSYNWLNSTLVTWKKLDGNQIQGILYTPENLDKTKKYPVIFNYYENLSHRLFEFPLPSYSDGNINIPWFVSRGYVVFTPDIQYSVADSPGGMLTGESAYNSVVSAAGHLSTFPFLDSSKFAVQGHSFGGGETNYIITHSQKFAAACSAACTVSDQISAYLGLRYKNGKPIGTFRLTHSEVGHDMIGATLWQRPDLYIKASTVFQADKVTTPLLLMHNQGDDITDWSQSIEFFVALRRLGKKVWMLQYDKSGHTADGQDAVDFTIRMTQFFDYYLKDSSAPIWMTQGMPRGMKGRMTGYDLDGENIP